MADSAQHRSGREFVVVEDKGKGKGRVSVSFDKGGNKKGGKMEGSEGKGVKAGEYDGFDSFSSKKAAAAAASSSSAAAAAAVMSSQLYDRQHLPLPSPQQHIPQHQQMQTQTQTQTQQPIGQCKGHGLEKRGVRLYQAYIEGFGKRKKEGEEERGGWWGM